MVRAVVDEFPILKDEEGEGFVSITNYNHILYNNLLTSYNA